MNFDREKTLKHLKKTNWKKFWKEFSDAMSPLVEKNRILRAKSLTKSRTQVRK